MLTRQEKFTLLFTFVVGVCFGVYLFFTGFMDVEEDVIPAVGDTVMLEIIGEAYGGCRDACPSFRVASDGTFRYIYTPGAGEAPVIREGSLPLPLQLELPTALAPAQLEAQSETITPSFCNSYTDGVDARYRITRDDVTYTLDTCGTTVDTDSALWGALVKIWNHFETI